MKYKITKFESPNHAHQIIEKVKNHTNLKAFNGINSSEIESLTITLRQNIASKDAQKIIDQHAKKCLEQMTKIEQEGITADHIDPIIMLIDDVIKNLKIRRMIFKQMKNEEANRLSPLLPHINNRVLNVATNDLELINEKNLLPYLLQHLKYLTQYIMQLKI